MYQYFWDKFGYSSVAVIPQFRTSWAATFDRTEIEKKDKY
jgi:hypothetical protein